VQVAILAGGFGTRLSEETDKLPKPMVRIGEMPILEHIINYYNSYGHSDIVILAGYKYEIIEEYFSNNYRFNNSKSAIRVIDTGLHTSTGGRIKKVENILDDVFLMTYGDGLIDVDINKTIDHFKKGNFLGSVTAVRPPARFGTLEIEENGVISKFQEKNKAEVGWINGGFFVMKKEICNFIDEEESLEGGALTLLANEGKLLAYKHEGWWQPMDTLREKKELESLWYSGNAPWIKNECN